jgi:hypothetical protein
MGLTKRKDGKIMATCQDCKKEMKRAKSCNKPQYVILDGISFWRDVSYYDHNKHCHDCNIVNEPGNLHHLGCDVERCPKCGGQLISCDCEKEF